MNYAITFESGRVMLYRRGEGIIVNEPIPIALSAEFLADILKDNIILHQDVLVAVPSSFDETNLREIKALLYAVGFGEVSFVKSVLAGAFALGADFEPALLAINLTENWTDFGFVSNFEIKDGGTIEEGGEALTDAIKNYIEEKKKAKLTDADAKLIREETATLIKRDQISVSVMAASGEDSRAGAGEVSGAGEKTQIVITGEDTIEAILPYYNKVAGIGLEMLGEAPIEEANEVRKGRVFVFGTGSQTAGLKEFLESRFSCGVVLNEDSLNAVITGAGALLTEPRILNKLIKLN
ncbi:MAG: rod shape-determining protein [Christensenellaceae bacterium]|jgi:actin-like ATPase involved in cell morphogenesis|nr:rod shape-determining protein [Christensenellaceae bacterium]